MSEEELTLRITVGGQSRSFPESDFIREIVALERAHILSAFDGPVTIEAIDNRGRVCWRGYYRNVETAARDLLDKLEHTERA